MTILKSPPHAPNGIYTRAGAKYKVYESIWNITRPLSHIRHTRQHVDFFRPPSRGAANHAVDAATVLGGTAVPSCALGRCVWTVRRTQGSSHQACASPAYNPNAGCWQIEQMQATAARTPPCVTKSRLRNSCMRAAALLGHGMQPSDGPHLAAALRPLSRSAERCRCLLRLTCQRSSRRAPIVRGTG